MPGARRGRSPLTKISRAVLVLRCGSCRFAALYFAPFAVALVASGGAGTLTFLLGTIHCLLTSLGVELLNRVSDEAEDRVNRSERTAMCTVVGYGALRRITQWVWAGVAVLDVIGLSLRPNLALAVVMIVSIVVPVSYSLGVRFKARRYLALAALTSVFTLPFVAGWIVGAASTRTVPVFTPLLPPIGIMSIFIAGLAGMKDITDMAGDEHIGYRSLWVSLVRRHQTFAFVCVGAAPHVVTLAGVAFGLLPPRFAWLLVLAPLGTSLGLSSMVAETDASRSALREVFYHFWFLLSGSTLFLFSPTPATLALLAASATYWFVTSQILHWSDGLRFWKVRATVGLVGRLTLRR